MSLNFIKIGHLVVPTPNVIAAGLCALTAGILVFSPRRAMNMTVDDTRGALDWSWHSVGIDEAAVMPPAHFIAVERGLASFFMLLACVLGVMHDPVTIRSTAAGCAATVVFNLYHHFKINKLGPHNLALHGLLAVMLGWSFALTYAKLEKPSQAYKKEK